MFLSEYRPVRDIFLNRFVSMDDGCNGRQQHASGLNEGINVDNSYFPVLTFPAFQSPCGRRGLSGLICGIGGKIKESSAPHENSGRKSWQFGGQFR